MVFGIVGRAGEGFAKAAEAGVHALSEVGSFDQAAVSVGIESGFPVRFDVRFGWLSVVLLDGGQALEEEAEFSGGGDGLAVFVGVGLGGGEDVDLVGESVGGDGAEDVGSVGLEVAEVGVDGGAGAAELGGDFFG